MGSGRLTSTNAVVMTGRCVFLVMVCVALPIAAHGVFGLPPQTSSNVDSAARAKSHWQTGYRLFKEGELNKAAAELRIAVQLMPASPQYLSALGIVLAKQGKNGEAVRYFKRAVQLDQGDLSTRRYLAAAQWSSGDLHEAEVNLQYILRHNPADRDSSLLLGMVLENSGSYAEAARRLSSVPDIIQQPPEAIAALLHCYYETSNSKEAHALETVLSQGNIDEKSIFLAAEVATKASDYDSAEALLSKLQTRHASPEIDYQFALLRYSAGKYREAENLLEKLIEGGQGNTDVFNLLGWCYAKANQINEAVQAFDQAITLDRQKEANYIDLASVLMNAGLLPAALQVANSVAEIAPESFEAYRIQGDIEVRQHDSVAAVQSYRKALALNGNSAVTWLSLGNALAAAGQFDQAGLVFESSIKRFPHHAELYYGYAVLLLHSDPSGSVANQQKGIALLQTALGKNASLPGAHYELGNVWLKQGKDEQAVKELEMAASENSSDPQIQYALWGVFRKLGKLSEADSHLRQFKRLKEKQQSAAVPAVSSSTVQ